MELLTDISYYVLLVVGGALAVWAVVWFFLYAFFFTGDDDWRW
jgi:hypothetical protein